MIDVGGFIPSGPDVKAYVRVFIVYLAPHALIGGYPNDCILLYVGAN